MLDKLIEATRTQDKQKIEEIINSIVEDKDSTIIKCENCGEIIAFMPTKELYLVALGGNQKPHLKYLVLEHMKNDPNHNIKIPIKFGVSYPISKTLESNLRLHCSRGDQNGPVDYETWFPTYVEYYYNKYIKKEDNT